MNNQVEKKVQTKAYRVYRLIRDTYYKVRKTTTQQAAFMKKEYDKRAKLHVFKPGDHCFVYIDGNKAKWAPRWKGPIRIMKRLSIHNYIVLMDPVKQVYKVINIQKMKVFTPNKYSRIEVKGNVMDKMGLEKFIEKEQRCQKNVKDEEDEWAIVEKDMKDSSNQNIYEDVRQDMTFNEISPRSPVQYPRRGVTGETINSPEDEEWVELQQGMSSPAEVTQRGSPSRDGLVPTAVRRGAHREAHNKKRGAFPQEFVKK